MQLLEKDPASASRSAAEVRRTDPALEKKLADANTTTPRTITARRREASREPSRQRRAGLAAIVPRAAHEARLASLARRACRRRRLLRPAGGAAVIFYWQTNNGIVRIEINDPDIKVAFDKNGPTITGVDKQTSS